MGAVVQAEEDVCADLKLLLNTLLRGEQLPIVTLAGAMNEAGVKPELECFDTGHTQGVWPLVDFQGVGLYEGNHDDDGGMQAEYVPVTPGSTIAVAAPCVRAAHAATAHSGPSFDRMATRSPAASPARSCM